MRHDRTHDRMVRGRAQEVLEQLRPLGRDAFVMLLANWTRGVKGKFKVPIFAHRELDLHTVFWAVQERGGYDAVSGAKLWKVARWLLTPAQHADMHGSPCLCTQLCSHRCPRRACAHRAPSVSPMRA